MKSNTVIELKDVILRLSGKEVLRCDSAGLKAGKLTALIGPNGSGKSSLIKAICGLHAVSGSLQLQGRELRSYSARDLARKVAVVFTGRSEIPGGLVTRELIEFGRYPWHGWNVNDKGSERDLVEKYAEVAGAGDFLNKPVWQLSDGEFQKAMIARALVQEAELLLLDEPLSFLDYPSRRAVLALLKSLTAEGKTILFSTHDLELALPLADACWEVEGRHPGVLSEREVAEAGRRMKD